MAEIHDEELMMNFQQGNVHAFELLFEKYRVPVFNFIYRMLNCEREPAEDLLQEIFVKLHKAKDFYEPKTKFSTWLFAIARNHCLNFIKSRRYLRARHTVSLDVCDSEDIPNLLERLPAKDGSRQDIKQREIQEILEQAICALPDEYKDVFLLRAVEGFTHQEVSRILKMNPATVRTQYHRAKLMLREKIGDVFDSRDIQRRPK